MTAARGHHASQCVRLRLGLLLGLSVWGDAPGVYTSFIKDRCIHNLIDGQSFHLIEILINSVIMFTVEQVPQRHKRFAPC